MTRRVLRITQCDWPVRGTFRISRSALSVIPTVQVEIREGDAVGRAECRPYARYGQTVASVSAELETLRAQIEAGLDRHALQSAAPAGPARNALDCALWDLEAKQSGVAVHVRVGLSQPEPRDTAFTLSIDTPDAMAAAAIEAKDFRLLKLKLGGEGVIERLSAVSEARPDARLILDANEAFDPEGFASLYEKLAPYLIALIEQPLPADIKTPLPRGSIPICADESLHTVDDLPALKAQGFGAVNVKLDKCGGFTAALALMRTAREMNMQVMAGCMVGSSLAMAPMVVLGELADVLDLDGPALLAEDVDDGLVYRNGQVSPPRPELWG